MSEYPAAPAWFEAVCKGVCAQLKSRAGLSLTYLGLTDASSYRSFVAADERGRTCAVVLYPGRDTGMYYLRGVVRRARRNSPLSWLSNGQVSKGVQVAHWREGEMVYELSQDEFLARFRASFSLERVRANMDRLSLCCPDRYLAAVREMLAA